MAAGDLLRRGTIEEIADFNKWLGKQPFDHKVVIAGNRDNFIEADERIAEKLLSNATYLSDELVTIEGMRIYGSPWTPIFLPNQAFSLERGSGALAKKWAQIPDNIDILLTHCAPSGMLDGAHLGCNLLRARLYGMKPPPKLHVFGHIHEGYGKWGAEDTLFINAALCDLKQELTHAPITVEI